METALQRIVKDRNYHIKQIEENLLKIKERYEAIASLEQATEKERKLVEEYTKIIKLLTAE